MWSSPRMTCVMPSQTSSIGDAKLYVGRPSERTSTRSSSFSFGNSMRPRTASSQAVTPSSGMRKRIAPSSSYALPSSTSRRASWAQSAIRSSWNVTSPSQSSPSQRSDSWICSVASATSRPVSVFSIRRRNSPPSWRAKSQLKSAVWTPPIWRKPVGLGAKRTTGGMAGRIVGAMFIGAHVSAAGGIHTAIDRAEAMGAESVQVFTQSPRAWRPTNHPPENFERFKERRSEVGIAGVFCHALYLVNLASPKDDFYEKSIAAMCNTVDVGCAIEADGVVFHVGSHLGAGMDAGLDRVVEAMKKVLDRCSETTWLLMENSAGPGGTIGRSVEELAELFERLERHPRLGVCLDSCHLYVSGCDVTDEAALDAVLDDLDREIGLERLRALHV